MVIETNKWLTVLAMSFIFFASLVIAVVFFIDPFLYYRNISNDKKLMEPRYASIGIIKNYKHDMTILGMDSNNSMDMLYIRNHHERKPVQLGIEDSNLNEVLMLYTLAQENSKSEVYFINIELDEFLKKEELNLSSKKFPEYLYNKSGLDDIKYLLNYEICFRYIPLNTIIDTAFKLKKSLPVSMQEGTEIDKVAYWKHDTIPIMNLAKGVKSDYSIKELKFDAVTNLNKVDSFLKIVLSQLKPDQTLIFGFMPNSVEYWANVSTSEFDLMMEAKAQIIKESIKNPNVKVVDLQGIPEVSNPINYNMQQNLQKDLIKIYTDSIFNGTVYSNSKSFYTNKKALEKQIRLYLEKKD